MNFTIDLGNWNSIFAVPSTVVDDHIKLAGSAQLKVLLWCLRHSGEAFEIDDISKALSMHPADVKDAMQYWIENKLIKNSDKIIKPFENITENKLKKEEKEEENIKKPRVRSRPNKLNQESVIKRIQESEEIGFLMQEAEVVLSRPISNSDASYLVMFHDIDGLPVDVIIMLIQYAVSIGKANMKYIEKVAISWGNEEINTLEKAEQKIKKLNEYNKSWNLVEKVMGIEHRSPTSKEEEMVHRWINEWNFNEELIKEAYERCINIKGKYIASYIDSIIKRWHSIGINTLKQAIEENNSRKSYNKKNHTQQMPSYNIEEYEKSSIFD